ncbi:MAG: hypothetical protein WAW90_01655 [Minisyncoccia bacterium]
MEDREMPNMMALCLIICTTALSGLSGNAMYMAFGIPAGILVYLWLDLKIILKNLDLARMDRKDEVSAFFSGKTWGRYDRHFPTNLYWKTVRAVMMVWMTVGASLAMIAFSCNLIMDIMVEHSIVYRVLFVLNVASTTVSIISITIAAFTPHLLIKKAGVEDYRNFLKGEARLGRILQNCNLADFLSTIIRPFWRKSDELTADNNLVR